MLSLLFLFAGKQNLPKQKNKNNLSNPRRNARINITFCGQTPKNTFRLAAYFCRQFVEHPLIPGRANRKPENIQMTITQDNVLRCIKPAKSSTAIGLDGLAIQMLKHIEVKGTNYLAHTFNLILCTFEILDMRKLGKLFQCRNQGNRNTKKLVLEANFFVYIKDQ